MNGGADSVRSGLFTRTLLQCLVVFFSDPRGSKAPIRQAICQCVQLTFFGTGQSTTKTANGEQGYRAVGIMDNSRQTSGVRALSHHAAYH